MMPDDVYREYSESGLKLKVTEMDETMLIEGTAESLLFLSKLFSAQAEAKSDSFGISPFGAGRAWFAPGSTKGIYIRRIENKPGK
jgi:hypothetical protein